MPSIVSPTSTMMTPPMATVPSGTIESPSTAMVSNVGHAADVYEGPRTRVPEERVEPREVEYDWGYRLKQYGTDALVIGGAALAFALLVSPEPIVTKIIGGIIALVCILGGTLGKHQFFQEAYLSQALEKAVGRLGQQIDQLDTDIENLESTRHGLEETNQSLEQTRVGIEREVNGLKQQVERLKTQVNDAFEELNTDRAAFETHKKVKLAQLNNEISEADARGDRAQRRLDVINKRESELNSFEQELETRRKNLVAAEAKLEKMQSALLGRMTGHA